MKIYYNSVSLTGAFGSATSGVISSCLAVGTTASTNMDIRNNSFYNAMTGTTPNNYAIYTVAGTTYTNINYNDYFSTGAFLGYIGGSAMADLAAIQTGTSQDGASINANPAYNSTSNLQPNIGSPLVGAGDNSTGITTDYLNVTRNDPPTIGAYEVAVDGSGPTITYTALTTTCNTSDRTFTATVSDASGVATGGLAPRVYYRKNGGTYVSSQGTFVSGTTWSFTIVAADMGGVTTSDVISYYVIAQDVLGNISSNPSGVVAGDVNTVTTPPTANSYTIGTTLSGTYTVGTGGNYATLTAAVTAYNTSCLNGPVVFSLTDASYSTGETFPIAINANGDANATNTLTIKPASGVTATITGAVASGALVKLNGADYVVIDGSNSGGLDKSLTITNTATSASIAAVWMSSLGPGAGATNNTLKNCNLSTGTVTTAPSYGIIVGGTTIPSIGADNDNATLQNNTITGTTVGIYAIGTASVTSGGNDNLSVTGNSVTTNTTVASIGIQVGNGLNGSITQNTLSIQNSSSSSPVGISLETGFVSSTVSKNLITKVLTTNSFGYGGRGIAVGTGTATSALTISNNMIYGVNGSNFSTFGNSSSIGIAIGIIGNSTTLTTITGGVNLYYNSVNMYGTYSRAGASITAALYVGSGASAMDIRNNIFVNTLNNTSATTGSKNYGVYSVAANTAFTMINYNDYYVPSQANATGLIGFLGADQSTIAAWRIATAQDVNSLNVAPNFTSSTDLHLVTSTNCALDGAATPISGVTIDYDGDTRNVTTPDIGADEFTATTPASPSVTGTTTICNSSTTTLTASGATGATFKWYDAATGGNLLASTAAYTTPALAATTNYYVEQITGACTSLRTVVTVTVNQPAAITAQPTNVTGCSTTANFTATVTGSPITLQWQASSDNGATFNNITDVSGVYTGTATNSLTINNTAGLDGYLYRLQGSSPSPCTATFTSNAVSFNVNFTWTGTTNTDWNTGTNWTCGIVPNSPTAVVVIPSAPANQPVIGTGTSFIIRNVTINSGATLINNGTLAITGTINNSGTFDAASGTIELAGTTAQTIAGSMFDNKLLKNLKISNNASLSNTIGDTLKLTGFLTFGGDNRTFTTNGNLTLISNAAGTASIADMTNGALLNTGNAIIGNASVERYIAQGRKWRFLSPNTINTSTINATWMEGQTPGTGTGTGYGMWITGSGGVINNFDANTNTPTMKYWDIATQNYVAVTNPSSFILTSQPAYMTYIRGDRSATGPGPSASVNVPTVLRTFGSLTQGPTSDITVAAGSGFAPIGNPFASAVDLTKLNYGTTNNKNIVVWDPNLGGTFGLGAFQYLTGLGSADFTITPGGGSYGADGSVMNTIESGQAFFMQGSASPRTVSFPETAKTPKEHDVFFTAGQEQKISGKLYINESGVLTLMDGALVRIHETYNTQIDYDDALKLGNTSENVSIKRTNTLLAIEFRNVPIAPFDTVQINMTGMRIKNYQWKFTLTNADAPGVAGFLIDRFLGTSTPLNLTGINIYDFAVTSTAGTYAADRFLIVFQQAVVVPVTLTKISAARKPDETVVVKWDVENEINISRYEIQRSGDGNSFTTLGNINAVNNAGGSASYNYTDVRSLSGINYYRIKAISGNGRIQYSAIVKVAGNDKSEMISVYPNPLTGREMSISFENKKSGTYTISLVNKAGQTIHRSAVNISSSNEVNKIKLGENLPAGSYQVMIVSPEGKREVKPIIVL